MNEVFTMLADVPPTLSAAWAVWFGAGVLLMVWFRKAKANLELQQASASRTVTRAKSGVRPSAVRRPPSPSDLPIALEDTPPMAARPKPAPVVVGDPFGDLATLLDQPTPAPPPAFRTPGEAPQLAHRPAGDSPILNSAGSPITPDFDPFKH